MESIWNYLTKEGGWLTVGGVITVFTALGGAYAWWLKRGMRTNESVVSSVEVQALLQNQLSATTTQAIETLQQLAKAEQEKIKAERDKISFELIIKHRDNTIEEMRDERNTIAEGFNELKKQFKEAEARHKLQLEELEARHKLQIEELEKKYSLIIAELTATIDQLCNEMREMRNTQNVDAGRTV